jgi:iron complex outermembrane receptor protein
MKKVSKTIYSLLLVAAIAPGQLAIAANGTEKSSTAITQQSKVLQGKVSDTLGPVIGATVLVKGTSKGTVTDIDGNFTLDVPANTVISISYIGYLTQEVKYTGQKSVNISLVEDSQSLEEVVVTAMGIKKEKRALPYAVSELKSEDIQLVPVQNVANSLYGKAPGVQIMQTAAGPTGGTKIQIRGINSVEGNTRPLIVIDGIPINDNDSDWSGRERSQTQPGSALNDINPDDIESMSILKGANAAALYGSRATNGVIVITSKRGGDRAGLGVDFSTSYTFDQIAYMPETQNVFGGGDSPFFDTNSSGQKIYSGDTYRSFGPRMDGTEVLWWDGKVRPYAPQPDNYKDLFKNGFTNNNSLSVSNRTEKSNFRLSYTNMNYGGFLENMKQQKNNFNFSGSIKMNDRISVDATVAYNTSNLTNPPTRIDRVSNYPMPRNEVAQLWKDHYKSEDGYFLTDEASELSSGNRSNIMNYLLWQQNENEYTQSRERLIASVALNAKIIESLSLKVRGGTDRYYDKKESKEMFTRYSNPADMTSLQGSYSIADNHYTKNYIDALFTFNQQFSDKLDFSLNAGASAEDISENGTSWNSDGLKYNGIFSTSNNKKNPKDASKDKGYQEGEFLGAVFASAQLAYDRFLYLDVTARNDWSSRLSAGNRSFFYPSVGLGFVFSDAFEVPEWLSYGKLRASYAIVGNSAPSRYFTLSTYNYDTFNGGAITNNFGSSVPPLNIIPEKTYSWEFGFEAKALEGRIGIDVAYYTNKTKNQILTVPVAASTGATGMKLNAGEIANHGVEIQLTGTPIETRNFAWDAVLNYSYTHNELVSLIPGMDDRMISNPWGAAHFKAVPGYASPSVFIQKWKRDDHGNKLIDSNGKYIIDPEFTYAGSAAPKFIGGFTNNFTYKNFSLSVHIDGQFGGKLLSVTNNYLKASGAGLQSLHGRDEEYGGLAYYINNSNQKVGLDSHQASVPAGMNDGNVYHDGMIADGVKADGSKNDVIVNTADYYNNRYNRPGSEDNLYDNSYIKLREMKFSYQIPSAVYSKLGLHNLRLSFVGTNLFFLYKSVPNVNPESTLGTGGTNSYMEYTTYPSSRSFGFALNASF